MLHAHLNLGRVLRRPKSFYLFPHSSTFHATRNFTKDQFNFRLHSVFSGLKSLFRLFRSLVIPIIYLLSRGGQSPSYKLERFDVRLESQRLKITSFFFRPLPYLSLSVHGQLLIYGGNQFTANSSSLFWFFHSVLLRLKHDYVSERWTEIGYSSYPV